MNELFNKLLSSPRAIFDWFFGTRNELQRCAAEPHLCRLE